MPRVVILPSALEDINKAARWYNKKQSGLGKRFIFHLKSKINIIEKHPQVFAIRYGIVQTAVVDVFPFMIHYSFRPTEDLIIILAVLHTSRSPETWADDD